MIYYQFVRLSGMVKGECDQIEPGDPGQAEMSNMRVGDWRVGVDTLGGCENYFRTPALDVQPKAVTIRLSGSDFWKRTDYRHGAG